MARGGRRPGSGLKKGQKLGPRASTLAAALNKELYREELRKMVVAELTPMTHAQIAQAKGIKFLIARLKSTGKFIRRVGATDPQTHDPDTEIIEVWEKDPSVQAYADLLNRALDKPIERQEHSGPAGAPIPYAWQR